MNEPCCVSDKTNQCLEGLPASCQRMASADRKQGLVTTTNSRWQWCLVWLGLGLKLVKENGEATEDTDIVMCHLPAEVWQKQILGLSNRLPREVMDCPNVMPLVKIRALAYQVGVRYNFCPHLI